MTDPQPTDSSKQILLKAAKLILKLPQKSLDIIKEKKLYHTKLIERSSKCTKDPNPLATTMILLNQKYPIALSIPETKKYGVPKAFLAPINNPTSADSHRHDHVLARMEVINWWIESSGVPSDQNKRLSDVLFLQADNDVSSYFAQNWSQAAIKWGTPILQRNKVRTREPIVDIPQHLRVSAIKEMFFPHYTVPNMSLPPSIVSELKERMDLILEDNLPLSKQIRIVLNALDPRERYLPTLASSGDENIPIKHAIVHNNLVVVNYHTTKPQGERSWSAPLKNFISNLIVEGKLSKIPPEELREICSKTQIGKLPVMSLAELVGTKDNIEFLWLKALYDRSTTLEYNRGRMTLCPVPTEGRDLAIFNKKNISIIEKRGNQIVNFKYTDLRGKFIHNGQVLIELVCNYTVNREFISLLKEIGTYINYRYQDTTGINMKTNTLQIERFIENNPSKFLSCTLTEFSRIAMLKQGETCGVYRFQPDSEYLTTGNFLVTLNDNLDVMMPSTRMIIPVNTTRAQTSPFTDDIYCPFPRMLNSFNMKSTLKEMFNFYLKNQHILIEKIREGDFKWRNHYPNKFLGGMGKQISKMARILCIRMCSDSKRNSHYICFLYCLCNRDAREMPIGPFKYTLPDGTILDLAADEGIFSYDQKKKTYRLFGERVSRVTHKLGRSELLSGVLEGFKLIHPAKEGLKIVSVRSIEEDSQKMNEGEMRNVYISGELYTAVKDSYIMMSTQATVNRQLDAIMKRIEGRGKQVILGKRWLDDCISEDEQDEPDKKRRKMEEEDASVSYDQDVYIGEQEDIEDIIEDSFMSDGEM